MLAAAVGRMLYVRLQSNEGRKQRTDDRRRKTTESILH